MGWRSKKYGLYLRFLEHPQSGLKRMDALNLDQPLPIGKQVQAIKRERDVATFSTMKESAAMNAPKRFDSFVEKMRFRLKRAVKNDAKSLKEVLDREGGRI